MCDRDVAVKAVSDPEKKADKSRRRNIRLIVNAIVINPLYIIKG
tara:strand:+ start:187 stop:318 length:132 start_codon:yes stop_codon:yes gene_type:complete